MNLNILAMANNYDTIFQNCNTEEQIKKVYRSYAKLAHPDKGAKPELMVKLNGFQEAALAKLNVKKNQLIVVDTEKFKYQYKRNFELGIQYFGNNYVLYEIPKDKTKYLENFKANYKLNYPNQENQTVNERFFPKFTELETEEYLYLKILKTPEVFCLADVLTQEKTIGIKHIAWITTRLCNLLCLLEFNNLTHNGINVNNCLVSIEHHSVVLSGWWYAKKENEKMLGAPIDVYNKMSFLTKTNKLANKATDFNSIKELIKVLNGGSMSDLPEPIKDWLQTEHKTAIELYETWETTLIKSFGARKFIKWNFKPNWL